MLNVDGFQGGLATILNWASLIFTSPSNLLIPFILFIVSKRHTASAILDANVSRANHVSPGIPQVSEVGTPSTPVGLTVTPEGVASPVENIPVVIITHSTDADPDSTDEVKTLVSKTSGEEGRSTYDAIPMSIMNRVSSPSRHRYYGEEVLNEDGDSSTSAGGADRRLLLLDTTGKASPEVRSQRRPSLSLSLSRSHSITHSAHTGMDEFLLISPTSPESQSHSVRAALSAHGPRLSVSTFFGSPAAPSTPDECHTRAGSVPPRDADVRLSVSTPTVRVEEPVPVFKAFPSLSPTSPIRSTIISAIGGLLAAGLVLTAIVYAIVQTVRAHEG